MTAVPATALSADVRAAAEAIEASLRFRLAVEFARLALALTHAEGGAP